MAPTDLPRCYTIESDSYPPDEAASLEALQYRQHHAAQYFRCAVVLPPSSVDNPTDSMKMSGEIVGFVTGTRCSAFDVDSMTVHDPNGSMLAIHSVVVAERHRHQGVGGTMLREYVQSIRKMSVKTPIDRIVLIAKADKLAFYVRAGFAVVGISPIVHGRDVWYECCCDLTGGSGLLPRGGSGASSSGASIAITGAVGVVVVVVALAMEVKPIHLPSADRPVQQQVAPFLVVLSVRVLVIWSELVVVAVVVVVAVA